MTARLFGLFERLARLFGAIEIRFQRERAFERGPSLDIVSLFQLCKTEMVVVPGLFGALLAARSNALIACCRSPLR